MSVKFHQNVHQEINESLSSIIFKINEKIVKNFDPSKSHGHKMLNICILKLCGESIFKSLILLFKSCLETGQFLSEWKKTDVFSVFRFLKAAINSYQNIIAQFHYFQSLIKFLKDYFTTRCLGFFSLKTN